MAQVIVLGCFFAITGYFWLWLFRFFWYHALWFVLGSFVFGILLGRHLKRRDTDAAMPPDM